MLVVLVVLALGFETVWHHMAHQAEHSYSYGQLEGFVDIVTSRKARPSPYGSVQHLQLTRELVNRAGGEFMTLGFLACLVYFCRQALGGPSQDKSPIGKLRSNGPFERFPLFIGVFVCVV